MPDGRPDGELHFGAGGEFAFGGVIGRRKLRACAVVGPKSGLITIEPVGGLGNRMRALDSAIALAVATGRRVRVVWVGNEYLNCPFVQLFEALPHEVSISEVSCLRRVTRLSYKIGLVGRSLRSNFYTEPRIRKLHGQGVDFASIPRRNLYFRTYSRFFPSERSFRDFVPLAHLRERIEALRRPHQIGVHIRRTDNVRSRRHSPTSRFIEMMEMALKTDPEACFFVATDSPEEEEILRKRFPGRVHASVKSSLDRRSPAAVMDALVDLYALAGCTKIIGSYWSSFSDVAAEIGRIEKTIARE